MRALEIGFVLDSWRSTTDGTTVRWAELRELAIQVEAMGFDSAPWPWWSLWRTRRVRRAASAPWSRAVRRSRARMPPVGARTGGGRAFHRPVRTNKPIQQS